MDLQILAPVEKGLFQQKVLDTAKVTDRIRKANDYHTLHEVIINQLNASAANSDNKDKRIYKVLNMDEKVNVTEQHRFIDSMQNDGAL